MKENQGKSVHTCVEIIIFRSEGGRGGGGGGGWEGVL